jgi:predicted transport protein
MKKQTVTQKKKDGNQALPSQNLNLNFTNAFKLQKGNVLQPLSPGQVNTDSAVEKQFRFAKELETLLFSNSKLIFGERSFFVQIQRKDQAVFEKGFIPNRILFSLNNIVKPQIYFLCSVFSEQNFYLNIFSQITKFLSYFKSQEIMEKVCKMIIQDKGVKKEVHGKLTNAGLLKLVKNALSKPSILIASDNELKELSEAKSVYSELQDAVKGIVIRKFSVNGDTVCTITPPFSEIQLNGKKRIPNAPVDEQFHLERSSDEIKKVYKKIKDELLKTNKNLQFNPQRYYISMRKDKNLAFFHFSKKQITLVVKVSEKETRKQIKHYEIKKLTEKVQKFWGAASCSIVIDNGGKLQEVINLLKRLIQV